MSTPTERNRLDEEASPYLVQHADNPVNWQPWDEGALSVARERDVPIFLSVGYAACHWCHVMEEESFQDEAVAELLNERFVPIKVDREERPDVDRIYQTICQLVQRRGGWPLSVWLTPEGKPFYVGTYFPKESKRGMPGFLDLLEGLADSWDDEREEIEGRAEQWTSALRDQLEDPPESAPEPPGSDALDVATAAALRSADREHGGFGGSPKFPQPTRVELLMCAHERTGRDPCREVPVETLDAMAEGGLYDHVGGGFHRYCVDEDWTVPHFEKMLYDNAELSKLYLRGYQFTGEDRYAEVARETFAFVERELTHPEGGFFSTLDARSETPAERLDEGEEPEHEEGAFYVWTPEEVRDALAGEVDEALDDETTADLFCDRFGIDEAGNFEGGTTVLTISRSYGDLAAEYDLDEAEIRERIETARSAIREIREGRPRPARDEKVLASWNGLMISALAEGALSLDPEYADRAAGALSFLRERLWEPDERLLKRRFKGGEVAVEGYLEDYAFLARGALDLYGVTGEVPHLRFALELGREMEERFWDDAAGTLYFTDADGEKLVVRPQEATDQSTPSSLGVALSVLLSLDQFVPHDRFEGIVDRALSTYGSRIEGNPLEHTTLALVADRFETGDFELTIAAESLPETWRTRLGETYLPSRLLAPRPPTAVGLDEWLDELGLDEAPPIWAERDAVDGEPTVYACRQFTCSPPVTEIDEALAWLDDPA